MIERSIYLEAIDPMEFFGVNNSNLDVIIKNFPKLKIVARGNEIKIEGDADELDLFEKKLKLLFEHYHRYNSLLKEDLEGILFEDVDTPVRKGNKDEILIYGNMGKLIKAETSGQHQMVEKVEKNDLMIAVGPAGSGKTYISIALAVRALRNKEVKKIILSRPAVEAGEQLGFLPGDLKEKLDPYLQPLYDALQDMIPSKKLKEYFEEGVIEIAPLAFMRGRTLNNAFVILDEAQNSTTKQLKMFLTRMGRNAKFIVTGDVTQIDLPSGKASGLLQAIKILRGIKGIAIVEYSDKDIVRHKLVKRIVDAYDQEEKIEAEKENKKENKNKKDKK